MPGRDGCEFCKLLKANPRTDSISVIFMTGLDDSANRRRGLSCGADDFVAKPFDADDVVLRVSRAVANKRSTEKLDNLHGDLEKLKLRIDGLFSALMSGQIPFRGGIPKFFDRRRKNLGPQARNGGIDAEHAIELRAMPELRAAL
ncbi:MAG: response regulator, partial [Verrucomicrobiae bacterium]|nr:response regulator [Verrucomicrobiae bacterium]